MVLICGLFSGHLLAQHQGHDYFPVQSLEQRLLHEADCDELRSRAEDTASCCANIITGSTRAKQRRITARRENGSYAPLRLGSVFISSSGLTEATMLPGWGILRI